jgi:hypothetical protein
MKKRSGSKIKVYREWNDKKPFKATLGKKLSNKGKHGNYDDVYMATIDGEDKEIKVAYGELSKMEPPRDVWFMMNSSELNEVKIKNQIKEEIIRILSEEEMTDDEMEKKAEKEAKSKEANEKNDIIEKIAKYQKSIRKVKDIMKDRAKDYKKAEGKEKDNIKTDLKTLTSVKKKIETKIKKLDKQL